ncbi:hypothetical protein FMM06_01985 [Glacieibacterium frigidum]|uniref:Uncharacterized protein n=1 Tax=Glacieibacterium frigidum TaxID=2593303 RepID=A0A552UFM2_9SPHN|nr:hypothetical protein FMM06_01985 [Glacieibacterium frigidum]
MRWNPAPPGRFAIFRGRRTADEASRHKVRPAARRRLMLFFSSGLGCGLSLLISVVATVILAMVFGWL